MSIEHTLSAQHRLIITDIDRFFNGVGGRTTGLQILVR